MHVSGPSSSWYGDHAHHYGVVAAVAVAVAQGVGGVGAGVGVAGVGGGRWLDKIRRQF